LNPSWEDLNARGYGWGGPALERILRRCSRCGDVALKHSQFCKHHDRSWRRQRLDEIRRGVGAPPTPLESERLFRADTKNAWTRNPWLPLATIWLEPRVEAEFIEDMRRAGMSPDTTAPCITNTLRWVWRRSLLNHADHEGWQRAIQSAKTKSSRIGLPPQDFQYTPSSAVPPDDPRIRVIVRKAAMHEPARVNPVVDRTTKAKQRRNTTIKAPKAAKGFDWQAHLNEHWLDVFGPLQHAHKITDADMDGETGRILAIAHKAMTDNKPGGLQQWHHMLLRLNRGATTLGAAKPTGPTKEEIAEARSAVRVYPWE
jgi:hypothetical protein